MRHAAAQAALGPFGESPLEVRQRRRFAGSETLTEVAPVCGGPRGLHFVFDALGKRRETESAGDGEQGLAQRHIVLVEQEPGNERAVDFDQCSGSRFRYDRRVARAEIIERDAQAELRIATAPRSKKVDLFHRARLGNFDAEVAGDFREARQLGAQRAEKLGLTQLRGATLM